MFCWAKTIRNLKHPLSSNRFGHVHKSTAVFYASLTSRLKRIKCRVNRPLQRLNFSRWNGTSSLLSFFSITDLIVAVGDQIEILTNGSHSNPLTLKSYNASVLVALAYDPSSQRLYFSDKRNRRGHVFSVSFDGIKAEGSVHDVIERSRNESVEALTYDNLEKALLWTDGSKQSIRRIVVDRADLHVYENNTIELVHLLEGDKPRGLVSDPCTRMMFWTNWNIDRPTIERSHLNGSNREIIVQKGLFMPHGLGLDVNQQMIYWANNLRHGTFQIERSKVDGSERQLLYEGKGHEMRGQFIFGLTVGERHIYWTDWDQKALWSLPKEGSVDGPVPLRRYRHKPMAVIVFQRHPVVCPITPSMDIHNSAATAVTNDSSIDQIIGIHDTPTTGINSSTVLTDTLQEIQGNTGPGGSDAALCNGYCLNEGHCFFVNDEISCSCTENFSGDRCEIVDAIESTSHKSCDRLLFADDAEYSEVFIALISTSVMCVILIIAVIILSFRVWRLSSSRSRFKRRIIRQAKHRRPAERVINIEDCCNMNICETPCTEPPSGATFPGQWSDKVNLLNCQF